MSDIHFRRLLYTFHDEIMRCQKCALKFSVENADGPGGPVKIGIGIRIHLLRSLLRQLVPSAVSNDTQPPFVLTGIGCIVVFGH